MLKIMLVGANCNARQRIIHCLGAGNLLILIECSQQALALMEADELVPDLVVIHFPEIHSVDWQALERLCKYSKARNIPLVPTGNQQLHAAHTPESCIEEMEFVGIETLDDAVKLDALMAELMMKKQQRDLPLPLEEVASSSHRARSSAIGQLQSLVTLKEFISLHLSAHQFNAERLAELLGLSDRDLRRKVKALSGLSTGRLILEMRLARAFALLSGIEGKHTVQSACTETGFVSRVHFSRSFKEKYHISPSQLLKLK